MYLSQYLNNWTLHNMEQIYLNKMNELGYDQLVCDIFINWENVKDEILPQDRKSGSGNGTIHVFLGAADARLRDEFPAYYDAVENGEDPALQAIKVTHYFLLSNIISMTGYVGQYYYNKRMDFTTPISTILSGLAQYRDEEGLVSTSSFFKLSTGANKLRPYFKQFDSEGVFTKVVRQILLPNSSYKISLFRNKEGEYATFWLIGFDWQSNFEADSSTIHFYASRQSRQEHHQQIFYGAPGTGKSNTIKREVDEKGKQSFRTTFHPDSDYSTFVGCYKPVMKQSTITKDGVTTTEEKIVYRFEPQAFTNAYVKAWNTNEDVYLIIEEINRGNCAQIFGDLFQLLDRKDDVSEYPVDADTALSKYIKEQLADSQRLDIPTEVKSGKKLMLPSNLYIWATMNTSDQSLFPIDSAFKRRWEWKYIPIKEHKDKKYTIEIGDKKYDWWGFLERINKVIGDTTSSEDKKLGYFFVKAENAVVSDEQFVGKVLFYIWNDVFKNYGFDHPIFSKGEKDRFEFSDFFNADGGSDKENVQLFLKRIEESIKMDIPLDITTKKDAPIPDEETTTTEA